MPLERFVSPQLHAAVAGNRDTVGMDLQVSLHQNIKFLLIEVEKQVARTGDYLRQPIPVLAEKIRASDDYVDNLKTFVQTKCFALAVDTPGTDKGRVARLKALEVVAVNLERISDFCEGVVNQVGHLQSEQVLAGVDFQPFILHMLGGLGQLTEALDSTDLQPALLACRAEREIDALYAEMLRGILVQLERGSHAQTQVTLLFISHYLERMGDSLLNAGEALLSARLGERIKIDQLRTLEDSLADVKSELGDILMHPVGETKSGARIARLTVRDGTQKSLIFKEGKASKLLEERDGIARWQAAMPGIAPDIYSFHEDGDRSVVLFEYLRGQTFEALLFERSRSRLEAALRRMTATLVEVWTTTRKSEPARPRFIQQLVSRLDDVRAVHPQLFARAGTIAGIELPEYTALVARCSGIDADLMCPHSVLIHGDFNLDNVIYDDVEDRVRFIDLHRSSYMDYCQDVSVFLVSSVRLQSFDPVFRRHVDWVIESFFDWACEYAASIGDASFPLRLALGMTRSYATSMRFVLDEALAREMFLKSRYLLEVVLTQLHEHGGRFRFPREVLLG
ncbi:MAG: PhoU domain-containing protein [Deltaproteobacteria bacterium]